MALDVEVKLIQTLPVALDVEIGDRPGDHFQEVHDRPYVQIRCLWERVELLDRCKARLVERRIDIPPLPLFRPGWNRPLQEGSHKGGDGQRALRGQRRPTGAQDPLDLTGATGT